jgi:chromosome segregation ATPase
MQVIETLQVQLKEGASRDSQLAEELERVQEFLAVVPQQLDDLRSVAQRLGADIERVRSHSSERDDLLLERVEEIRQQFDQALRDIAAVSDQRAERVQAEFETLQAVDRELRYRIDLIEVRLDELREIDRQLRAELWRLLEQRLRLRFEQAQQELEQFIEQRQRAERGEGPVS